MNARNPIVPFISGARALGTRQPDGTLVLTAAESDWLAAHFAGVKVLGGAAALGYYPVDRPENVEDRSRDAAHVARRNLCDWLLDRTRKFIPVWKDDKPIAGDLGGRIHREFRAELVVAPPFPPIWTDPPE